MKIRKKGAITEGFLLKIIVYSFFFILAMLFLYGAISGKLWEILGVLG